VRAASHARGGSRGMSASREPQPALTHQSQQAARQTHAEVLAQVRVQVQATRKRPASTQTSVR